MSMRLTGPSTKFGETFLSHDFATLEIGEPEEPKERIFRHLAKNSFVLDANKYFMLPDKGLHATFVEREDFGSEREESRHQVRFGQIILNGPGIYEAPDFVAIKPFEDRRELYNEWAANSYVNSAFDDQRAFLPLGVLKDKHGVNSLVSLYEHGVKTADTVFWADKESQPEALRSKVIEKAAITSMYSLGLMHGARLIHGDAQAKNLGWDNRHTRFIDLESSTLIPRDAVDEKEYTNKILNDIVMFLDSTVQVDENRDAIANALKKPQVIQEMIKSYRAGVRKASLRQEGQHIPDYGQIYEEQIRAALERIFG